MSYKTFKYILVFMMSIFFLSPTLLAEGNKKDGRNPGLDKTNVQKSATYLNINKISTYFFNNGISDISSDGNSGLFYPKGSGKTAVFTSGLLWGAMVSGDPDPRMGGTAYRTGLVPGKVLPDGTADVSTLDKYRIYRVRADIYSGGPAINLSSAAFAEGVSEAELRAEYEKDWTEWPAEMGAPFEDVDANGSYDPLVDIPGVPGADQTLWYVTNDLTSTQTRFLYGANPLGIELQTTVWAYNRAGALGSMYFRKYKVINITDRTANPITFDDMYFSMFSDVDNGDAGDDYVGVDTTLSLQYCYNASPTDATYSPLPPPAVGFDFFQGPLVIGLAGEDKNKNTIDDALDYGIFDGKKVGPGLINLPMTAAYYFANGDDNIGDPPQGEIQGSREFYNFIRGRFGVSGQPFIDLITGLPTTYALNGDPITGTGWLDGVQLPAGDRRQGSASGPFTMAPGDTQEVVVAEIVAGATPGSDNLKAITSLKNYDKIAQNAYDQFFQLPAAPPQPVVNAIELDQTIVLDWGSSLADVEKTEADTNKTFIFQGYNIYQLPTSSSDKSAGVRIATYDVVDGIKTIMDATVDPISGVEYLSPAQYGDDYGISRSIKLEKDYIKQSPLVNGIKYYYAVTAYSYSPDSLEVPNNLENPLLIFTVIPQSSAPGERYNNNAGDTLVVEHLGGSDGSVSPIVLDPRVLNGHTYRVNFTADGTWSLTDISTTPPTVKLENQTNQSGDNVYLNIDGFSTVVEGPPVQVNDYSFTPSADRWFTGVNAGLETFFGGLGIGANFFGSNITPDQYVTVEIRFVTDRNNGQRAYRYLRGGTPNYSYQDYELQYFTVWDVDANPPRQLSVGYVEQNGSVAANSTWQPTATQGDREYLFIFNDNYTEAPAEYYTSRLANTNADELPTLYAMWPLQRGDMPFNPQDGQVFKIIPNYANTVNDVFTFIATAPDNSQALAKEDVKKINVFPNPYYGVNSEELNKYNRFVTFTHLPAKAKVRLFNLAGVPVRTIDKDDPTQFLRWDLLNNSGLPVASGLYIAYIELPDLGETKIVKIAIIQEQQILDRF